MYVWQLIQRLSEAPAMSEVLLGVDDKWYRVDAPGSHEGLDLSEASESFCIVAGELDNEEEEATC